MSTLTLLGIVSLLLVMAFTIAVYRDDTAHDGLQTRRQAIVEVWIGICIGFALNWFLNWFLLPMVGARFTGMENFWLGAIYTLASVIRGYAIRRWASRNITAFSAWVASALTSKRLGESGRN